MADLEKAYCISCGEETRLEKVDLGIEDGQLYRCAQCGAYLGTEKALLEAGKKPEASPAHVQAQRTEPAAPADFHSETSTVGTGPIPEIPGPGAPAGQLPACATDDILTPDPAAEPSPKLETIILAEDSELVTRILKDMILRKGLSGRVISCKNGFDFVINYLSSRRAQVSIGLIILDVIMPVLNGISASVAVRAWEKALGLEPIPILFFTAKRCDETFKRVIQYARPAIYINKGVSESAANLELRIEKVINQLLKESF